MKKGSHHTEETKEKIRIANTGKHRSEETKEKMRINHADISGENNPNYGNRYQLSEETKEKMRRAKLGKSSGIKGKHHTEEVKEKIRIAHLGKYHTEETKEEMRKAKKGENNPNWKGGISYEPYCLKFNYKFKEEIRERFGRQCFICGKSEEQNGRKLSVHHVNYNKDCLCNESKCYFVPLCDTCHGKTNQNREFCEKLLTDCCEDEYMMMYFEDFKVDIWNINNYGTAMDK